MRHINSYFSNFSLSCRFLIIFCSVIFNLHAFNQEDFLALQEEDVTIVYFDSSDMELYLPNDLSIEEASIVADATENNTHENRGFFSYITTWEGIKDLGKTIISALHYFKENNSYDNYIKEEWDQRTEEWFTQGYLQFGGYYQDKMDKGRTPYGKEINDKIRVTLINGILNIRTDLELLLKTFSTSHGGIPIHFVFRPTEGWTKDLLTSTLSKMGYTSAYAKLLAETWKEKIEEMGGVNQGGKILHYAHSIGATDTYVARTLMTPEELKMIDVITLGSPSIIPNSSGYASVKNYVSIRDGVCLLDPIGYFIDSFNGNSKTEFIGTFWGLPLIDHTLYTDSYGKMIQKLGKEFVKEYQHSNGVMQSA